MKLCSFNERMAAASDHRFEIVILAASLAVRVQPDDSPHLRATRKSVLPRFVSESFTRVVDDTSCFGPRSVLKLVGLCLLIRFAV